MIQDIFPHVFANQFISDNNISDTDYLFYFNENSLLLKNHNSGHSIPQRKDFDTIPNSKEIFLFTLDNTNCYLLLECPQYNDTLFTFLDINTFRTFNSKEIAWVGIVGFQLYTWYTQNKYCGKCGSKTTLKPDERAIVCPECGQSIYPKISPAIIVAIISNNKILLASNKNFRQNWYSLVAGYADIGETLEDAVKREVKEEVGIDVYNIKYYKSQPWPYSGSMMIGFIAEADDKQPVIPDNKEISDAAWYSRGNLPAHPSNISIAGEMIELFENSNL